MDVIVTLIVTLHFYIVQIHECKQYMCNDHVIHIFIDICTLYQMLVENKHFRILKYVTCGLPLKLMVFIIINDKDMKISNKIINRP